MRNAGLSIRGNHSEVPASMSVELPGDQGKREAWVAPEKTPEWLVALAIVVKHWRLSAIFASMVIATAAIVTFSIKPIYEPIARLEVDPPGETFSLNGSSGATDAEYLETQSQNLKNTRLAVAVVR